MNFISWIAANPSPRPIRSNGSVCARSLAEARMLGTRTAGTWCRSPATPSVGSGSRSHTPGLRLFGRGQGKRQFFQGAEVAQGRLGCRPPGRYRKRTRRYRPGADAGTAYEPVAGFDPAAVIGSRGFPHSARRWLFGNLLQYWHQQIFLLLSCFSVRPKPARTSPASQFATRGNRVQAGHRPTIPPDCRLGRTAGASIAKRARAEVHFRTRSKAQRSTLRLQSGL
jgi:hypothetical protein